MIFTVFLAVLGSCSEAPPPSVKDDPLILERDSLLAIYGDQMEMKEFDYLKVYEHGISDNTYLYGKQEGLFWMGLFSSPSKIVKEYRLDLDPEKLLTDAYFQPAGFSYPASGFELLEIYGFEETSAKEDSPVSKSILRIALDDFELKRTSTYLPKNQLTQMEFARRWKGGFLLEHTGIISKNGKSSTQYLSTDLTENILWDCRASTSPPLGVYYFDVDFFLELGANSVGGFDYSTCKKWSANILDFFGLSTCPGCSTSLKLLNQIDDNITLEAILNEEMRHVVMDYRSGTVLSNEIVEG